MFKNIFRKKTSLPVQSASSIEQRRYVRFPILRFMDLKVILRLLVSVDSHEFEGTLENFSAGGVAIRIQQPLQEKSIMYVQVQMPHLCIACHGEIKHVKKKGAEYIIGIQFLDLPEELKHVILTMTKEYLACGEKIKKYLPNNCSSRCSVYAICHRVEKVYEQPPS